MFVLISSTLFGQITLDVAFQNLFFTRPVDVQNAGDGSNRLFVVEQPGIIRVFENDPDVATAAVFLDIRNRVDDSSNEEGLLGLAFHPAFPDSAYFYVNYTASSPNRTVIARYTVSVTDSNAADPASEYVIMEIDKPFANHNAGAMAFGPNDGYLYITTGDGGSGGDPQNNGQNRATLLGNILRINVDSTASGLNYSIPDDNPFKGNINGWREEIFAFGLRNPWRMSFDPLTGWLWAADVGQNSLEEIDIIESGKNYGWRLMEGDQCFDPPNCDTTGLTFPIWVYNRSQGQSVTGGYVYRGSNIPDFYGKYIYADFGSGRIWILQYDGSGPAVNTLFDDTNLNVATFGVDEAGELYLGAFDGRIYRFNFNPNGVGVTEPLPNGFQLAQNYPNPFNPKTTIPFALSRSATVRLGIFDANGQSVRQWNWAYLAPGNYTIEWDGRRSDGVAVAGGVYFYRLIVDQQFSETKQLQLVK